MAGAVSYTPVTSSTIWPAWNRAYSNSAITTGTTLYIPTDPVWTAWNGQLYNVTTTAGTSANYYPITWQSWNTTYTETAGQRAARETAQARAAAEWEAGRPEREAAAARRQLEAERARAERARATSRALELLESCLTLDQWRSYRELGYFEVISSRGRRWRIRKETQAGNVDLMAAEGNVREASFCVHPPDSLPNPDAHLAQKLQLETDEDGLLAVANVVHLRPGLRRDQLRAA